MLNKSILIGRHVLEPELKTTPQGTEVCSFRIAVNRAYTSKCGEKKADFISIVAWRKTAIFVSKYFHRGDLIGIEGSIQTRDYTDKDGNTRYVTEVVADRCFFVGNKSNNNSNGNSKSEFPSSGISYSNGVNGNFQVIDNDDCPF